MLFPLQQSIIFYDFIAPKPSFFRPLPRFPAEFEHDTTYKQMAHGLFSLQFSRFSFALGGFCHFHPFNGFLCNFLGFPLLWAASAKNAEKVVISRFPPDFEHVTNKSRWHMVYFLCKFQFFPLLWTASAKLLKKLSFPCFSHCRKASFLWFHRAKGTKKPSFFRPLPRFPAEFEHVITYKPMAHGLFSLQFSQCSFALGGFCQIPDKLQFPSFQWVSLPFSIFSFALGALHRGKQLIKLQLPMRSCTILYFLERVQAVEIRCFHRYLHTVGMPFWCLSCFIAKNITPSDGRFRRFSRYSMFICHQFFVAHLCHQGVTPYILTNINQYKCILTIINQYKPIQTNINVY